MLVKVYCKETFYKLLVIRHFFHDCILSVDFELSKQMYLRSSQVDHKPLLVFAMDREHT